MLRFNSRSADHPPGRGSREHVAVPADYGPLAGQHFRRVLSNFHVQPFTYTAPEGLGRLSGCRFNSIEHVFQASKIALVDPEAAFRFTLDSGDALGAGDGAMAQKNRKLVRLAPVQLARWDLVKGGIMARAAACKHAQCPEFRTVLHQTRHAQLWHIVSRQPAVRFAHLEALRGAGYVE